MKRDSFPVFARHPNTIFADGAAGTQVPSSVIQSVCDYYSNGLSNTHGVFPCSSATDSVVTEARDAMAIFFNCSPHEVSFGQNMTSLTFAVSRVLAKTWTAEDEIVVTRLDHDANVTPWVLAARDTKCSVQYVDINLDDCTLNFSSLESVLSKKTKLVALTCASNATGSVTDIVQAVRIIRAKAPAAMIYLDAVHYSPHHPIDVSAWGCDFLVCSSYKFFGPHTGCLYAREATTKSLEVYKVVPVPNENPDRWETGTQSIESLAGIVAAVKYICSIGSGDETSTRAGLLQAYEKIREHEENLSRVFLEAVDRKLGSERFRLFGIRDLTKVQNRTPTFSFHLPKVTKNLAAIATELSSRHNINAWDGNNYAVQVFERLGYPEGGIRLSFVHYNTVEEVLKIVEALEAI